MAEVKIKMDKDELDNLLFEHYSKNFGLKGYQIIQPEVKNFVDLIVKFKKEDENVDSSYLVWVEDMKYILNETLSEMGYEYYDLKVLVEQNKITGIEYKVRTKSKRK